MSGSRQTIVQLCPRLNSGGIERGTVDLAVVLKEAGYNSIIISGGGFLEFELKDAGVRHINLPIYSKNPFIFAINLIRLSKILKKLKPDIVHPRSRIPTWLVFLIRNKLKAHFVTSCNGIHSLDKFGFKNIYNGVLVKGDVVVSNSEFTKSYLLNNYKVSADKVTVNYRGIDLEKYKPNSVDLETVKLLSEKWGINNSKIKILLPARLAHWKGQHVFIEACRILKAKFKLNYVALLVGDCENKSYLNELIALIDRYSLQEEVRIMGESQDMSSVYELSDIVVSSSIEPEAFGRGIVEAQTMAKPVIASAHGGARETISSGETGWLYPPGDAEALAEKIVYVSNLSSEAKATIARNAIQQAQLKFSKEAMCDTYIRLYRSLKVM